MTLDFEALHRDLLTGSNGPTGWSFKPANPKKQGADFYAASHQIFSNNALNVSLLIRNTFDGQGNAITATPLLALAFSRKVDGSYLLSKDTEKIVIPLGVAGAIQLYGFMNGLIDDLLIEVARPGTQSKYLKGYMASDQAYRFILKAYTTASDGYYQQVEVALSQEHVFHLQAFMLSLGKVNYPWMEQRVVSDLFLSSCGGSTRQYGASNAKAAETPQSGHKPLQGGRVEEARSPEQSSNTPRHIDPAKAATAIFAVGINKWPAKRRDVISFIQETAPVEQMDRLIKAGNAGDFSEWDRIAAYMDGQ